MQSSWHHLTGVRCGCILLWNNSTALWVDTVHRRQQQQKQLWEDFKNECPVQARGVVEPCSLWALCCWVMDAAWVITGRWGQNPGKQSKTSGHWVSSLRSSGTLTSQGQVSLHLCVCVCGRGSFQTFLINQISLLSVTQFELRISQKLISSTIIISAGLYRPNRETDDTVGSLLKCWHM